MSASDSGAGGSAAAGSSGTTSESMSGITSNSGGRSGGRGRGGRGGRGRFGGRRQGAPTAAAKKFAGRSTTLEGHVYDLSTPSATAAAFYDTTMEIAEFVGRTYTKGNYTKLEIESLRTQEIPKPAMATNADGTVSTDEVDKEIFKQEVSAFVKGRDKLKENRQNAFSLIWGQCSDNIRTKVKSSTSFDKLSAEADVIGLLQGVRTVMLQFQTRKYQPLAILESKRRVINFRQGKLTVGEYYRLFKQKVEATEHNGGSFGYETTLIQAALPTGTTIDSATAAEMAAAVAIVRDRTLSVMFLSGADEERYADLSIDLENDYTRGENNYSKTLDDAYARLDAYHPKRSRNRQQSSHAAGMATEVAFTSDGEELVAGTNGKTFAHVECHACNKHGHYSNKCPSRGESEAEGAVQMLMNAYEEGELSDFSFLHSEYFLQQEDAQKYSEGPWKGQGAVQCWRGYDRPHRGPSRISRAGLVHA
ncbi:expressed unknown protein [Seminavis robusta]|uniref:CCHC-type domain-containing protein n=1 Tax=Seminavis robusta TaxID=568900 RepID=A0A9N8E4L0_9STRA|nr:expressed unknown protein [Seminavis robusta]|eukprot:Sro644_g180520.1 n/a (477) ;mRNA; r:46470-47968